MNNLRTYGESPAEQFKALMDYDNDRTLAVTLSRVENTIGIVFAGQMLVIGRPEDARQVAAMLHSAADALEGK